ncbi:MAG: hypothetical protein LBI05_08720 [Planctomycetaceae bacterium]|jgi:hypothetical protein|nr:hypothetical protein [Planctomycetaceae bacterium]
MSNNEVPTSESGICRLSFPLAFLLTALLIFGIAVPIYYQTYRLPQEQAKNAYQCLQTQEEGELRHEITALRGRIAALEKTQPENLNEEIVQQVDREIVEVQLTVNEKYLEKRRQETADAKRRWQQSKEQETPFIRDVWFFIMGLPSVLAVIALLLGFTHLKRLRKTTHKSGLIRASLTLLLAPFLLPLFVISQFFIALPEATRIPMSVSGEIYVFLLGMVVLYFFGLYAIIRATRQEAPPYLHPRRGTIAATLVLLSLLFPIVALTGSLPLSWLVRGDLMSIAHWENVTVKEEEQRYHELQEAFYDLEKNTVNIRDKALKLAGSDQQSLSETRDAYNIALNHITEETTQTHMWNRRAQRFHVSHGSDVYVRRANIAIFSSMVLPILFFALPGTILGLGYAARIRRERERPGLAAGLFAALCYPLMVVIGGTVIWILVFSFTGVLIMLAVMGILVGTYFAVQYWLAH